MTKEIDSKRFTAKFNDENGNVISFIPAFTRYSIKRKVVSSASTTTDEVIQRENLLPTVFPYTYPEIFINEREPLYDYDGEEISQEELKDNTVYVYLEKADNLRLFHKYKEDMPVKIIKCETLREAYTLIMNTFQYSHLPSKDELFGLSGAASGEQVLKDIRNFGIKHHLSGTASQGYFGLNVKSSVLKKRAVFNAPIDYPSNIRSFEEAEDLYTAMKDSFGEKTAGQSRYVAALRYCIRIYADLGIIIKALKLVSEEEKAEIKKEPSDTKCYHIEDVLTRHIQEILAKEKASN